MAVDLRTRARQSAAASGAPRPPHSSRHLEITKAPTGALKGSRTETDFVRQLSTLLESESPSDTAAVFVNIVSPDRNGNSEFMDAVLPKVALGTIVKRVAIRQTKGLWDASQYPRLLEGIAPSFRTRASFRAALGRDMLPPARRALIVVLWLLPSAAVFFTSSLFFSFLLNDVQATPAMGPVDAMLRALRACAALPLWVYLVSLLIAVLADVAARNRDDLIAFLLRGAGADAGYRLTDDQRAFLARDGFKAIRRLLARGLAGPLVVWVDDASHLDDFSTEALVEIFVKSRPPCPGKCVLVCQFTDATATLYFRIREHCEALAGDKHQLEARLVSVTLEERLKIALAIGRSEADARTTPLVADLVELDEPMLQGLRNAWEELKQEELSQPGDLAAGATLLAVLATAGLGGPRQFQKAELQRILTSKTSTFSRWMQLAKRQAYRRADLEEELKALAGRGDAKFIHRRVVEGEDEWAVDPAIRGVMIKILQEDPTFWGSVHAFWAAYIAERFDPQAQPSDPGETPPSQGRQPAPESVRLLLSHLLATRLPESAGLDSTGTLALRRTLLLAANRALTSLVQWAQFDAAHGLLEHVTKTLLADTASWESDEFARAVERLSEQVWRLASAWGASDVIERFQTVVDTNGRAAGKKGIAASIEIYRAFNAALRLTPTEMDVLMESPISGGDEESRALLHNMRAYAVNASRITRACLAIEVLEVMGAGGLMRVVDDDSFLVPPMASPRFDFFEFLVRSQHARLLMQRGRVEEAFSMLNAAASRIDAVRRTAVETDFLIRALVGLSAADNHLTRIHCKWSGRLALGRLLPSPARETTDADTVDQVLEELEEAEFFQELCQVRIGTAQLRVVRLRLEWLSSDLQRGTRESTALDERWVAARRDCEALGWLNLRASADAVRAGIKSGLPAYVAAHGSLAREVVRIDAVGPAQFLVPRFSNVALLMRDSANYRAARESLHYLTGTRPEANDEASLDWRLWNIEAAQFSRLLGEPREALKELDIAAAIEPTRYEEGLRDRATQLAMEAALQRAWCYDSLNETENARTTVIDGLALPGVEAWYGYPLLRAEKMRIDARLGASVEPIATFLDDLQRAQEHRPFTREVLAKALSVLLRIPRSKDLPEALRLRVEQSCLELLPDISEWSGIETALGIVKGYLDWTTRADDAICMKFEELVAVEASSVTKITEFKKELDRGTATTLFEYLIARFSNRIELVGTLPAEMKSWLEGDQPFPRELLTQLKELAPAALEVTGANGKIVLHTATLALHRAVKDLPDDSSEREAFQRALWKVTRSTLSTIITLQVLHPRLVRAMKTYLALCDEISGHLN